MTKLSTDREILQCIYDEYADAFSKAQLEPDKDASRIYVPIDIPAIAKRIDNNAHVLFGRLYYHLDHKHRYRQDDGSYVYLFAFKVGNSRHGINYPYLAAILAQHREEHSASRVTRWLAVAALVLSLGSIVAQVATQAEPASRSRLIQVLFRAG